MATTRENLHIQSPELLTAAQRGRDTIVTALMWGVYLYLWVPLLSLLAWLLGFEFAYDVMVRSGGARDLSAVLLVYAVIIGVIFCVVTIWSLVNRVRFRGVTRRQPVSAIGDDELAAYFAVAPELVARLRSEKTVGVDFDDAGRPVLAAESEPRDG